MNDFWLEIEKWHRYSWPPRKSTNKQTSKHTTNQTCSICVHHSKLVHMFDITWLILHTCCISNIYPNMIYFFYNQIWMSFESNDTCSSSFAVLPKFEHIYWNSLISSFAFKIFPKISDQISIYMNNWNSNWQRQLLHSLDTCIRIECRIF